MLVLSRRPQDTIHFPNLGIAVEILRVAGKTVRVGIKAPSEIKVLRGELSDGFSWSPDSLPNVASLEQQSQQHHELRNRLNRVRLALHLLNKQLDAGQYLDAETSLESALEAIAALDHATLSPCSDQHSSNESARRALVVEDNANERELFAGLLRMHGFSVAAVEDGAAALSYLEMNESPDVILLDMQMPRMNGPETVRRIRQMGAFRDVKLFAVSGMEQRESGIATGEEGVDGWFRKPIEPRQFADRLRTELVA